MTPIRKILSGVFIICASIQLQAQDQYAWVEKPNIPAVGRHRACGCSIGNRGYIGMGHISNGNQNIAYPDWWEYDPGTESWMQKANFPTGTRYHAIAFSIGNFAYVGTGTDQNFTDRDDMWKYSPASNTWTPVANILGGARSGALAFTINGKGYVTMGDWQTDCQEYNPVTNTWTMKASSIVSGYSTVGAVYNGKAYCGVGSSTLWGCFDPVANTWTPLPAFPGISRFGSGCFEYNGWIYVVSGSNWATEYNDTWAFNPLTNQWVQVSDFPGQARHYFVCFKIGNLVYGGTGTSGTNYHDFWEFGTLSGINDQKTESGVNVFPNPVIDRAEFDFKEKLNSEAVFNLFDINGKKIKEETIQPCDFWMFDRNDLAAGIYSYSISTSTKTIANGKLILQ